MRADGPSIARGGRTPRRIGRVFPESPAARVGLLLLAAWALAAGLADRLAPWPPGVIAGSALRPPGTTHPLGTDALGRDLLSGLLHGARPSLGAALGVALAALVLGGAVGVLAGHRGGRLDRILMGITRFFESTPRLIVAIPVLVAFGPRLTVLVAVLALTSWMRPARLLRAQVAALSASPFVTAARALGASRGRILRSEVLPNALPALAVVGTIACEALLLEAGLGFLGLGDPGLVSWGRLAGDARGLLAAAGWVPALVGLCIFTAALALRLAGDAVAEALGGSPV